MTVVVALHGAPGAGKTTLIRKISEYLGSDCLSIEENPEDLFRSSSTDDKQTIWFLKTTDIVCRDELAHFILERISPLSLIVFTVVCYLVTNTVWPMVTLFIGVFTICRSWRFFSSYMISKSWQCNVSALFHCERNSRCRWIWQDRTCLDIYTFCLVNKASAVPLNMPEILLKQTRSTSVAIIMDVPRNLTEKNLRTRLTAPTTTATMRFFTRLIVWFNLFIQNILAALEFLERWYAIMNVPVIKISQLKEKLDHNTTTGNIQWTQHSIDVLIEAIKQAIEQRGPLRSTIDQSLIPWQIARKSHLYLE